MQNVDISVQYVKKYSNSHRDMVHPSLPYSCRTVHFHLSLHALYFSHRWVSSITSNNLPLIPEPTQYHNYLPHCHSITLSLIFYIYIISHIATLSPVIFHQHIKFLNLIRNCRIKSFVVWFCQVALTFDISGVTITVVLTTFL